jgi:hypothetical protein
MIHFKGQFYEEELIYSFKSDQFEFDDLWNIIIDVIKPDSIGEAEITSWTEANSFEKNGLKFSFEKLYCVNPSEFYLRLLPLGKHNKEDIAQLKQVADILECNI